jgi:hypothetical protein
VDEVRVRHVRLVHLHEVDAHEERLVRVLRRFVEIVDGRLLHVLVEERNPDATGTPFLRRVHVLTVDLEFLNRLLACFA